MLKMNIISKVEIDPISQEFLEELLRNAIKEQNPEVYVNSFTFTQRRSPACIEVTVDAQIGAPTKVGDTVGGNTPVETVEANYVEEAKTEEVAAPVEETEAESIEKVDEAMSVEDIFGGNM